MNSYHEDMNQHVRDVVKAKMTQTHTTQLMLESSTGIKQSAISRLLTGRSGRVLDTWARMFKVLGLELIAVDASRIEEFKALQLHEGKTSHE